ncbi:MAG: quinone-interacting membrane-bound oxidoreductase complex subunit QmoC [Desulfovibrionales bacterium]|nr:quinone-interacting membrane-bound oxidoreductase complex subunit QmoC [Desulfovibrionales bacterium]
MAGYSVDPDVKFVKEIQKLGGESLKKCFQCATCSVICPLSSDEKPFPRKEMIWAQWGLKDKLVKNGDIWACHQCGDCSTYCPRGARPGDVIAAARAYAIREYAFPRFMGNLVGEGKYLPVILAIPLVIILLVLAALGNLKIPAGEIVYSKFLPIKFVDSIFLPFAGLAIISLGLGLRNFWNDISPSRYRHLVGRNFLKSLVETIVEILGHVRFRKCGANIGRLTAHLAVFYGFVGLFTTTNIVVFYEYILHRETPLPLYDPAKIIGNISAIILFIGISLIIRNRLANPDQSSSYFDWALILMILGVTVSGILTELLRLADIANLAYPMYVLHLMFVFYIIGYLPYSKLAHMVYRTVALAYKRHIETKSEPVR